MNLIKSVSIEVQSIFANHTFFISSTDLIVWLRDCEEANESEEVKAFCRAAVKTIKSISEK